LKQLRLFQGEAAPKRKRKRGNWRKKWLVMTDHHVTVGWPQGFPTAVPFFRAMADRSKYVLDGPLDKPLPWQYYHQLFLKEEHRKPGPCRSVKGQVDPHIVEVPAVFDMDIRPTAKGMDGAFGKEYAVEKHERERRKRGRTLFAKEPCFKPSIEAALALRDKDNSPFKK
jgi:hypothetical protein